MSEVQKALEASRNTRYQWISCLFNLGLLLAHGIIFYWIPRSIRLSRYIKSNRFKPFFKTLDAWYTLNSKFSITIRKKQFFFKPSLLLLFICFILLNGKFSYIETDDIDYIDRTIVIAKRCARVGLGSLPAMFLLISKGDFITGVTGLSNERGYFFHKWFSNMMFVLVTAHVIIMCVKWSNGTISPTYPKNAYGIIGYVTYVILQFGNNKYLRRYFYEGIMINHRTQSFIMLLVVFFHNDKSKAMVILGVHLLVLDKVVNRIIGIIHYKKSPTKGYATFDILDDDTLKVTVPVKTHKKNPNNWWTMLNYKYGTWKAGSHIYLNVRKVAFFEHHPFCIASLPEDKEMVLIIKTKNGFTKKLYQKVKQMKEDSSDEEVKLKTMFRGPSGAKFQPLITFDCVGFIIEDLGASFALPACLDLLQTIQSKNESKDLLFRPTNPKIKIYWKQIDLLNHYNFVIEKLKPFVINGTLSIEIFTEDIEMKDIESKDHTITTMIDPLLNFHNELNLPNVLLDLVTSLNPEPKQFKSLAVISCGNDDFGSKVEVEVQKYRWHKDINLYFYNESFNT